MSWRIFQQWFNAPPWKGAEYIRDNHGEKFWIYWCDNLEEIAKLRVRYRGHPAGHVNLIEEDEKILTLADIYLPKPYRKRGIGKEILKRIVQWARQNDFQKIWGFIKPDEETTLEYLREWYKRQGFRVYEAKPGVYHILLDLEGDTN